MGLGPYEKKGPIVFCKIAKFWNPLMIVDKARSDSSKYSKMIGFERASCSSLQISEPSTLGLCTH